jgi:uncharacterized protein (UPF0548 family)
VPEQVSDAVLEGAELQELLDSPLTYQEVGRTRGNLPDRYHHLHRTLVVGSGHERFEAAAGTLLAWGMHRRAGVSVRASSPSVGEGAVAVLRLGWHVLGVSAPVRVVYVVDEDRRRGFAYGTLPGHPERGEESFVVEHLEDDTVRFAITAFSRPATLLTKLGGPVSRLVQSRVTNRYLRAV